MNGFVMFTFVIAAAVACAVVVHVSIRMNARSRNSGLFPSLFTVLFVIVDVFTTSTSVIRVGVVGGRCGMSTAVIVMR